MSTLPKSVDVRDDTMREGLQIESRDIPVEAKLRLLDALGETGLKTISIGSFVSSSPCYRRFGTPGLASRNSDCICTTSAAWPTSAITRRCASA